MKSKQDIASKWNVRYAFSGEPVPPPAEVLSTGSRFLPDADADADAGQRHALDLACGRAGSGEWLAARGFHVTAWDISTAAIDAIRSRPGSRIAVAEVRDVSSLPPPPAQFDVIVVARFLDRALCPSIAAALTPGGVLFYQTFTRGLSNPDYLLKTGELPGLFPSLKVLLHEEPAADSEGRAEARLIAVN